MALLRLPKAVWKQTIYSTPTTKTGGFFEKISRMRLRKKGIKPAYRGLESMYGMYKWNEKGAVIYLSVKDLVSVFLRVETLLHEFLHYITTTFLPTPLENVLDDLVDLLL
jgi:hypothetical protein